jgi:hypothetical protein
MADTPAYKERAYAHPNRPNNVKVVQGKDKASGRVGVKKQQPSTGGVQAPVAPAPAPTPPARPGAAGLVNKIKEAGVAGRKGSTPERKSHGPATNAPNPGAGGSRSKYASQIEAESTLRFSPEQSALSAALSDALSQRDSTIASARSARDAAIQTSRQSAPGIKAIESDALGQIDQAIATQTPGLSQDLARTRSRLAERMALASAENTNRATAAAAGYQGAVNAANGAAADTRSKIMARLQSLGQEMGAYAQGRASELAKDDADRKSQESMNAADNTTALLAAGVDADPNSPTYGQIKPGGPKDPAANGENAKDRAKSLASPDQISAMAVNVKRAMQKAAAARKAGWSRKQTADMLMKDIAAAGGEGVYTQTDTKNGGVTQDRVLNPDGTQKTTPKSDAWKAVSPLEASIALDMVWDGGVSSRNVKRLHNPRQRYSVQELNANGLELVTQHQLSQKQKAAAKTQTANTVAQGGINSVASVVDNLFGLPG